jgi:hypothetical protein
MVTVDGPPILKSLTVPTADPRTVGIVKVSRTARTAGAPALPWTAVVKIALTADTSAAGTVQWTPPTKYLAELEDFAARG